MAVGRTRVSEKNQLAISDRLYLSLGGWMLGVCPARSSVWKVCGHLSFWQRNTCLNRDGSYEQQFVIEAQPQVTTHGTWDFDSKHQSRVTLREFVNVHAGFGKLNSDWRVEQSGNSSLGIEVQWFKVIMGGGGDYPYIGSSRGRES